MLFVWSATAIHGQSFYINAGIKSNNSGWSPNVAVTITDLARFHSQMQEQMVRLQSLLFGLCFELANRQFNVHWKVLDTLTAHLLKYYSQPKAPNDTSKSVGSDDPEEVTQHGWRSHLDKLLRVFPRNRSMAIVSADRGGSVHEGEADLRLEVILKIIDDELSIAELEAIRHSVNVGDIVHVHGFVERIPPKDADARESLLLHARNIVVVKSWRELHPGVPFLPVPTIHTDRTHQHRAPQLHTDASSGDQNVKSDSPSKDAGSTNKEHCKFWINSRTCQHGDKCEFFHVSDAALKEERAKWLQERLHLKRLRARHEDDPLDAHSKHGKQQRAEVFVDWLVETFGKDFLSSGKGVVDVAGGRGNVSFELWNKRSIPCTLIDPRPMKLSKMQFKYMKRQRIEKNEIAAALVPQKLGLFNETSFFEDPDNETMIQEASILIGMHPDEATDSILNVAIKYNKPFAVVPCCVFGHKFPERKLPNGERVVSYEHLVEHLQAKHHDIAKGFLPFNGKNLVLYRHQHHEHGGQ